MIPSLSVVAGEHQCPLLTSSVAEAKVTYSVAAADRIVVVVPDEPPQPNAGAEAGPQPPGAAEGVQQPCLLRRGQRRRVEPSRAIRVRLASVRHGHSGTVQSGSRPRWTAM